MRFLFLRCLLVASLFATGCAASATIEPTAVVGAAQSGQATPVPVAPRSLSRLQAIEQLSALAFLPFDDAACVIDSFHSTAGNYDFGRADEFDATEQSALIDVCTRPTPVPQVSVREVLPEFDGAELIEGSVRLKGTTINYLISAPPGFEVGDDAPVLINLPPMNSELANSNAAQLNFLSVAVLFAHEAAHRGWVVITPYGNRGNLFDSQNVALMPDLIRWMSDWVEIEGGRPHIGGMGRGGEGAFTFATQYPDTFQSLMVYPGAPDAGSAIDLSGLTRLPVRMWVAGDDAVWLERMQRTATRLDEAGADVVIEVLPVSDSAILIQDAVVVFDELEAAR